MNGEDFGPLGHSVLTADFVTTEDGTGLVHTALAFGEDDFRLGEERGMTLQNPVRLDGTYDERVTDFQGKMVFQHNPEIVAALDESGRLYRSEEYEHSYPHCWRCDTPLLYYAKSSWYIRTTEVRDRMLAENETIGWHPEHIKHGRFGGGWRTTWTGRSRASAIGEPRCRSGAARNRTAARRSARARWMSFESAAATCPTTSTAPTSMTSSCACAASGCDGEMRRVPEVIDTWYDSGSMPFAQFHHPFEGSAEFEARFPADYICEAIDQTRGWFYSLLAVSTLLFDRTSYENCVCLGLILDPEGQKMSKSRGNVVDPWEVISAHGADAFRWYYFTAQQPWAGYRFSIETVGEAVRQFLNQLWNTYSFWVLYANAEGLGPADLGEAPATGPSPRTWIAGWSRGSRAPSQLCARDGRFRLDLVGPRDRRLRRTSSRTGTYASIAAASGRAIVLRSPPSATACWGSRSCWRPSPLRRGRDPLNLTGDEESVHLPDFPEPDAARRDPELEAGVEAMLRAIELGRAARALPRR